MIQCAARKREDAGFLQTREGKPVLFVADPTSAPASDNCVYARPDDPSDHCGSWREVLVRYNEAPGNNPLSLLPAFELYERDTYRALVKRFGIDKTYILSAGWGLIPASFLTPYYDVTFTANADDWLPSPPLCSDLSLCRARFRRPQTIGGFRPQPCSALLFWEEHRKYSSRPFGFRGDRAG